MITTLAAIGAALIVIDGDTIRSDVERIRLEGIDAAEIGHTKCEAERRLAILAKHRLEQLLGSGDVTTPDAAVPETVRAMVEKAVDQSREVYDRSKDALDASVATLERTFDAAGQGAVAVNRKIIDIAQRNVNSGFDLAKSLAGAKNLSEMVELQAAYWQKLLGALTSQAEEVRALSTKVAAAAGEPLKEQVKRGVDELRKAN